MRSGRSSRFAAALCASFARVSIFAAVLVSSCSAEKLEELKVEEVKVVVVAPLARIRGEFCTAKAQAVVTKLKFLFIIDKSGSNEDNITSPGTDKDGQRRYGPLRAFLEKRDKLVNTSFALLNFSTRPNRVSVFTEDTGAFLQTIDKQANPTSSIPPKPNDEGWTNFIDTFREAKTIIQEDVDKSKKAGGAAATNYVIFFVSDGAPIVENELQKREDVLATVSALLALQKTNPDQVESVTINAAYYYGTVDDPNARAYMKAIAEKAEGNFSEFSGSTKVNFEQFSVPERKSLVEARDLYVENTSAVWEEGLWLPDTDRDRLSNQREEKLGSNPLRSDSDGNGIGDGVEHFVFGKPCKGESCAPESAQKPAACLSLERDKNAPDSGAFVDSDNDGLSDCEELGALGSDRELIDSNDDGLPDGLAFRHRIALLRGAKETRTDPDFDGVTNAREVKIGTPVDFNNSKIIGFKPMIQRLIKAADKNGKSCYRVEVDDIQVHTESDVLRVSVTEGSPLFSRRTVLRRAEKPVGDLAKGLVEFVDSDFK